METRAIVSHHRKRIVMWRQQAEAHVLLSGLVLSIPIEVVGKQEVNRGILRRLILSVQKRAYGKRRQISNEKSA